MTHHQSSCAYCNAAMVCPNGCSEVSLQERIVEAAKGVRIHGSDYKNGTHANLLWALVDRLIAGKK